MSKRKNKSTSSMFIVILITILIISLYNMNGGNIDFKSGISKITEKIKGEETVEETSNQEITVKISEDKVYIDDQEIDLDHLNEKLNDYNKDEIVIKVIDSNGKRTVYSNVIEQLHEKNFIVIEEKE